MRIALLLLIRDLCLRLGAFVLSGDFYKGAERELLSGGCDSQRRISPLEAAVNSACVPWHALGVTPLWGRCDEPPRQQMARVLRVCHAARVAEPEAGCAARVL